MPIWLSFNENFKCQNQLPQLIWSFSYLQMLVYNLHIYGPLHARTNSPRGELTHSLVPMDSYGVEHMLKMSHYTMHSPCAYSPEFV